MGWGHREKLEEGQRSDRTEEQLGVVGKGEEVGAGTDT